MKRICLIILMALVAAFWMAALSRADVVALAWASNNPDQDGVRVFQRMAGQPYDYASPVWHGTAAGCTITGLVPGTVYYFVVRAYLGGDESGDSNEVCYTAAGSLPAKPTSITLSKENGMPYLNTAAVAGTEIDHYDVEIDGTVVRVDPQRDEQAGTARLHYDVTDVSSGKHSARIRGVNMWGEGQYCDPFVFTKALPSKPSGIGLSDE